MSGKLSSIEYAELAGLKITSNYISVNEPDNKIVIEWICSRIKHLEDKKDATT